MIHIRERKQNKFCPFSRVRNSLCFLCRVDYQNPNGCLEQAVGFTLNPSKQYGDPAALEVIFKSCFCFLGRVF